MRLLSAEPKKSAEKDINLRSVNNDNNSVERTAPTSLASPQLSVSSPEQHVAAVDDSDSIENVNKPLTDENDEKCETVKPKSRKRNVKSSIPSENKHDPKVSPNGSNRIDNAVSTVTDRSEYLKEV
ncbi:hypothetical protein HHI36_018118 [Cryptolaemus montrouzieri]|uniref:Uncharacterized protein n=1 Tax=Cryptolaemus montrouzieri TaxID=559131 RepID=A0ABD2NZ25_9CUCU